MIVVAIVYLLIGHTDYVIKAVGGRRNEVSISIYKTIRHIGWILLAAALLNLIYESLYWNLCYLFLGFFAVYIIRLSNSVLVGRSEKNETP